MSKDDKGKEPPHRTGSTAPQDEALSLWLNALWARNEPPERLELYQMFGRNKNTRGEMIHHVDFKPDEKKDIEDANRLGNEIYKVAQDDCDSVRRESWYQIAIIDKDRRAIPLVRRLGPLRPQRQYAIARAGDLDENEDEPQDGKALDLERVKVSFEEARWDKQRYDKVMGQMLILQDNTIRNQQAWIDRLFSQHIAWAEKLQEAQDRQLDRDLIREKEKFKLGLWKDGIRTARNLLPGLFGANGNGGGGGGENGGGTPANGDGNGNGSPTKYGSSQERTLVDNFLTDCEETKDDADVPISIALFGDFEEREGKIVQIKPGIFSLRQYKVLLGVSQGGLPPDALDNLMPGSNHKDAITKEQIEKAQDAGVTEGIGTAIFELVGLRSRAKEAAQVLDTSSSVDK